ncbi:hypothetical protein FKM82_028619 [Ascaphus truei]
MGRPQKSSPSEGTPAHPEKGVCSPKTNLVLSRNSSPAACTAPAGPPPQVTTTTRAARPVTEKGGRRATGTPLHTASTPQPIPKVSGTEPTAPKRDSSANSPGSACARRPAVKQQLQKSSQRAGDDPSSPRPAGKSPARPIARKLSLEDIANIERETVGQSENSTWHEWRQNRITASLAHQISHSRFANQQSEEVPKSYLKAVLGTGARVQTAAMTWGVKNERAAVRAYERLASERAGGPVKVDDCGLFIHPGKNWLAASPDGIVKDGRTGKTLGILEVKCPYKHRENTVREACADRYFCLRLDGESYTLRTDHAYYTQVQCQLAATGQRVADFVVYTKKETAVVPVRFDPKFWEDTEPKLERFYTKGVLPLLQKRGARGEQAAVEGGGSAGSRRVRGDVEEVREPEERRVWVAEE